MLEPLRAWLNGNKEYYTGVALYEKVGSNTALLSLFKKGPSTFTISRLEASLLELCKQLKSKQIVETPKKDIPEELKAQLDELQDIKTELEDKVDELEDTVNELEEKVEELEAKQEQEPINQELYDAAKASAAKQYKETMNARAVLFSMANTGDFSDPNTADRITARAKLSLQVVQGFIKTSQLYDNADFVKVNGRLPDQEPGDTQEYDHLPENLVKQTLDNLRKNINKIKKREQTPERVALLQKHELNLQKLNDKWLSLKSVTP